MKRTCNNCKALNERGCSLGYKTKEKDKTILGFIITSYFPDEECPKPKTIKEYVKLYDSRR